mmetsp:Transcript_23543/g.84025  ORF Transcript_23543/g.84025 Transcript_23543/m.84025 type:complete len:247 (+) Transcript_23543:614-1354(+)
MTARRKGSAGGMTAKTSEMTAGAAAEPGPESHLDALPLCSGAAAGAGCGAGVGGAASGAGAAGSLGPPKLKTMAAGLGGGAWRIMVCGCGASRSALPHWTWTRTPSTAALSSAANASAASSRFTNETKPRFRRRRSSSDRGHMTLTEKTSPNWPKSWFSFSSVTVCARFATIKFVVSLYVTPSSRRGTGAGAYAGAGSSTATPSPRIVFRDLSSSNRESISRFFLGGFGASTTEPSNMAESDGVGR